jgi:UDP-N-acetyl-D-mannosaminuronate dehydrogenase
MEKKVVVAGLGEVGRPLFELVSKHYETIGIDVASDIEAIERVEILHVCYPFEICDFIGETARYIALWRPQLTIVNSTVAIGTTREIANRSSAAVVNSPIRGKHACMLDELYRYTKFVGALDSATGQQATKHFESVGLKTKLLSTPEATELAKLTETTYFGLMITWAQEVERYCDRTGQSYDDVVSFYDEIPYLPPVKYFPGIIGGHCVMPNIEILRQCDDSQLLKLIEFSNSEKLKRNTRENKCAVAI